MKSSILLLISLFICSACFSLESELITQVKEVTIYHSGALVKRTSQTELNIGLHELRIDNISKKTVLNSLKFENKEITILNKTLLVKLTNEEFNQLLDKKEALTKQLQLIENKFGEENFVSEVEDLETMTEFYLSKTLEIKRQLRKIESKISDAEKLNQIKLQNEDAAILKLLVSVESPLEKQLSIKYVCGGIGWSPSYNITVKDASQTNLHLKFMAKVMSQTGENWENIKVHFSSSFPLEEPTQLPLPKGPWVLKRGDLELANPIPQNQNTEKLEQIDMLEGIEYQEIKVPYMLEIRTLEGSYSIKSNSTIFTFPILQETLPAEFYYFGFPSIEPQTYLVSEIKGWSSLGLVDGVCNINYKGNDLGRTILKFSETTETLMLPIGKDNSVYLDREQIADKQYFKESISGKKNKSTLAYSYTVKNNNPFPIKFELSEQIPISQSKYNDVKVTELSNATHTAETGDISWVIHLDKGVSETKKLIYTVELDGAYALKFNSSRRAKFRTISAPSF